MSTTIATAHIDQSPWAIPSTWIWTSMGDATTIVGGGTPRSTEPSNYEAGDVPWITPADLSGYKDTYIAQGARNLSQRGLTNSGARLMPAGTVLFSSRAPIGYVAIASQSVSTNQGFKSFVLPKGLDSVYVYYFLKRAKELAVGLANGTTFLEISGAKAALIPLPLPPLPEQHRIVAVIEEQFTRLDAAVASLERARANLKRYRAAVLAAACSGRLVPTEAELARAEGRGYEPADTLLDLQHKNRSKPEVIARDTSQNKLPYLPDGWTVATMGQLVSRSEYGTSVKCSYDADGMPVLRIPNIAQGSVDLTDIKRATQPLAVTDIDALQPNDLLMCRTNGSINLIGRTALVRNSLTPNHTFASYLLRFRFAMGDPLPRWVNFYMGGEPGRTFLETNSASSAGQHNVSLSLIHRMHIPLPPLAEQHRIVAEVERRLSIVEAMEASVAASLARAERLRQAVLRKAFAGELVPQDPADEPASGLLERIRAERSMVPGKTGRASGRPRKPKEPRRALF